MIQDNNPPKEQSAQEETHQRVLITTNSKPAKQRTSAVAS